MVGSVLLQRMQAEGDFALIEPVFFTTSQVGGKGPSVGRDSAPLQDASDIEALKKLDVILTCQGSDYTIATYDKLRAAGSAASNAVQSNMSRALMYLRRGGNGASSP